MFGGIGFPSTLSELTLVSWLSLSLCLFLAYEESLIQDPLSPFFVEVGT